MTNWKENKQLKYWCRGKLKVAFSLLLLPNECDFGYRSTCRIDYCNGCLYGLPDCELNKLQRVQNAATRLLTSIKPQISPYYTVLFCKSYTGCQLGLKYILLLTFKILNGMASAYII